MSGADISYYAFVAFNGIRVVSYLPQIIVVARDVHGASAISYLTWTLWTAANASTAVYAWINLSEQALTGISFANTVCCLIVIGLTICKRRRFKKSLACDPAPFQARRGAPLRIAS